MLIISRTFIFYLNLFLLLVFRELQHGIPITDENDNRLGESTKAAQQAITQVVVSRILMASPGMGMEVFSHSEVFSFSLSLFGHRYDD